MADLPGSANPAPEADDFVRRAIESIVDKAPRLGDAPSPEQETRAQPWADVAVPASTNKRPLEELLADYAERVAEAPGAVARLPRETPPGLAFFERFAKRLGRRRPDEARGSGGRRRGGGGGEPQGSGSRRGGSGNGRRPASRGTAASEMVVEPNASSGRRSRRGVAATPAGPLAAAPGTEQRSSGTRRRRGRGGGGGRPQAGAGGVTGAPAGSSPQGGRNDGSSRGAVPGGQRGPRSSGPAPANGQPNAPRAGRRRRGRGRGRGGNGAAADGASPA